MQCVPCLLIWFLGTGIVFVAVCCFDFQLSSSLVLPCVERSMDVHEVTVNYRESGHGNDKRKLCQLGYSVSFELSMSFRGNHYQPSRFINNI